MSIAKVGKAQVPVCDDGDNPGAGSKSVRSNGLNDQMLGLTGQIDQEHNADGTHMAAIIDGTNLKSTCVDGSSLVQDGSTKKLKVNALGILGSMLANALLLPAHFSAACINSATFIADAIITGAKLVAGTVGTTQLTDGGVTGAKISHDNSRTKVLIPIGGALANDSSGTYAVVAGQQTTSGFCLSFNRPGYITGCVANSDAGEQKQMTIAYGTAGCGFAANDKLAIISLFMSGGPGGFYIPLVITGPGLGTGLQLASFAPPSTHFLGYLEVEFT